MPKASPKTPTGKPKASAKKQAAPRASWLLLSPVMVLVAIGIGAAAGGTCMVAGCFSFLEDAPLPPVPTMPAFSPVAMRTAIPTATPSPTAGNGLWGDFIPDSVGAGFDPLLSAGNATLPASASIDVPFTSQAPLGGQWSELHNEACEEASALMVNAYVKRKGVFAKQATDKALRDMVAWEGENGYKNDVTATELVAIFDKYFTLSAKAYSGTDVSVENIKRLLSAGYPVIVPAAGKKLGNPYFTPPGPDYHMLVITGYDERGFIVNDPGTRRGEKYRYGFDTLIGAIHDWTGDKKTVDTGQRAMVVVQPQES